MRVIIFVLFHSLEVRRNVVICIIGTIYKLSAIQVNGIISYLFKWAKSPFWKCSYQLLTEIGFPFSREVQKIDEIRILHCCALLIFAWGDQIALTYFYTAFVEYSLVQKLSVLWLWSSNSLINVWTCEAWNLSFGIDLCVNLSQNSVSFKHLGANFQRGLFFTDTVMYL